MASNTQIFLMLCLSWAVCVALGWCARDVFVEKEKAEHETQHIEK